jgi:hypothetical protein
MERWCKHNQDLVDENPLLADRPGEFILIDTDVVEESTFCDGRVWRVDQQHALTTRQGLGYETAQPAYFACEHLLEMD